MRVLDPGVSPRRRVYNPTVRRRRCRLRSSSLAASFTSRPCSHARTHIHIQREREREKDEALPPTLLLLLLPSSADTAAKELVPPRTLSVVLSHRGRIHPDRTRSRAESRAARYLHHYSDFLFPPFPRLSLIHPPSPPRADRCSRWRLFFLPNLLFAPSLARALATVPLLPLSPVCVYVSPLTPGKHETRRRTDGWTDGWTNERTNERSTRDTDGTKRNARKGRARGVDVFPRLFREPRPEVRPSSADRRERRAVWRTRTNV